MQEDQGTLHLRLFLPSPSSPPSSSLLFADSSFFFDNSTTPAISTLLAAVINPSAQSASFRSNEQKQRQLILFVLPLSFSSPPSTFLVVFLLRPSNLQSRHHRSYRARKASSLSAPSNPPSPPSKILHPSIPLENPRHLALSSVILSLDPKIADSPSFSASRTSLQESEPACCPFCMEPNFGIVYTRPKVRSQLTCPSLGSPSFDLLLLDLLLVRSREPRLTFRITFRWPASTRPSSRSSPIHLLHVRSLDRRKRLWDQLGRSEP